MTLKPLVRHYRTESFLLFVSATSMVLFVLGSIQLERFSSRRPPIARLITGSVSRKTVSESSLSLIEKGSPIYNLDAIWVGKDQTASLAFDDDTTLEIKPKTLLVLKVPFASQVQDLEFGLTTLVKVTKKQFVAHRESVELSKGTATLTDSSQSEVLGEQGEQKLQGYAEIPTRPIPRGEQNTEKLIYPKNHSVLVEKASTNVPMQFSWPTLATGYLVLRNTADSATVYLAIRNQSYFRAKLPANDSGYLWQVIDDNKKVIYGPFQFDVKSLSNQSVRKILQEPLKRKVDIYW